MSSLRASPPRKSPRRIGTPAKTTLFAGRMSSLRASPPRKSPAAIFANKLDALGAAQALVPQQHLLVDPLQALGGLLPAVGSLDVHARAVTELPGELGIVGKPQ